LRENNIPYNEETKKEVSIMVVIAVLGATLVTVLIIAINDADKEEHK